MGATPHHVSSLVESYFWGNLGIVHAVWLNLCALTVTACILCCLANCCLPFWTTAPFHNMMDRVSRARRAHYNRGRIDATELQEMHSISEPMTIPYAEEAQTPPKEGNPSRIRSILRFPRVRFRKRTQEVQMSGLTHETTLPDINRSEEGNSSNPEDSLTHQSTSTTRDRHSVLRQWTPYLTRRQPEFVVIDAHQSEEAV